MGVIHKGEPFTHEPDRFELFAHRRKQLGEPSRPNAGADRGEQAVVGLRQGESIKPFGRQIFFQQPCQFSIGEVFQELQEQTAKLPLDAIAVGPFELAQACQGFGGIRQIDLKPALGISGW